MRAHSSCAPIPALEKITGPAGGLAALAIWLALASATAFAQPSASGETGRDASRPPAHWEHPLYLQADELIYEASGRVIARGKVEIYYLNYIVTADEVTYDEASQTLSAAGNVNLRHPNGSSMNAERAVLPVDVRDAFGRSLPPREPRRD